MATVLMPSIGYSQVEVGSPYPVGTVGGEKDPIVTMDLTIFGPPPVGTEMAHYDVVAVEHWGQVRWYGLFPIFDPQWDPSMPWAEAVEANSYVDNVSLAVRWTSGHLTEEYVTRHHAFEMSHPEIDEVEVEVVFGTIQGFDGTDYVAIAILETTYLDPEGIDPLWIEAGLDLSPRHALNLMWVDLYNGVLDAPTLIAGIRKAQDFERDITCIHPRPDPRDPMNRPRPVLPCDDSQLVFSPPSGRYTDPTPEARACMDDAKKCRQRSLIAWEKAADDCDQKRDDDSWQFFGCAFAIPLGPWGTALCVGAVWGNQERIHRKCKRRAGWHWERIHVECVDKAQDCCDTHGWCQQY